MKAIAINGSPRKNWNTDLLLQQALKGAAEIDYAVAVSRNVGKKIKKCHRNPPNIMLFVGDDRGEFKA